MDYGKIISTGFKQAWKYKTLWILGFLVSGGGGGSFDILNNIGQRKFGDYGGIGGFGEAEIRRLFMEYLPIIILVVLGLLFIGLIFWILGTIAIGGLTDAARCLKENREFRFGSSWSVGAKKFWSIFGLGLLNFIVLFAFVIMLVVIGFIAFKIHTAIGVLSLVIMVPLFIVVLFLAEVTVAVAKRIIIIEDKTVFDAIAEGFNLWKAQLGSSILFAILYFFLTVGIGIATMLAMIPIVIPFVAIGFVNVWLAILLGVPVLILVLVCLSGFTGASLHLMTTEFYYQLRGITGQPAFATMPAGDYPPPTYSPDSPLPPPPPSPPPIPDNPPPESGSAPQMTPPPSPDEPQRPDTDR